MTINLPKFDSPITLNYFYLYMNFSLASRSILKYFAPVLKALDESLKELPDPNGRLSIAVPPPAIKMTQKR